MKRVLLVAATTGYQVREFAEAARTLDVELVLATDRCHILENPWGDDAAAVRFEDPEPGIEGLAARGPFDGILAVGDRPACVAAQAAERLGLRFHPAEAARAAANKLLAREHFRAGGLQVPEFRRMALADAALAHVRFPCVLKPLDSSASRGVIRANNQEEFRAAVERIARIQDGDLLVEDYIPGHEFALEGVVTGGKLHTLALFDKPDPLEGPYFEETIYVTPSREPEEIQRQIRETAQAAVTALGLSDGPVHAEMRVNDHGVWILEAAARPIGGLCSRVLHFVSPHLTGSYWTLEQLLLRHAMGEDVSSATLAAGAHGVMMIPIPHAGVYRGVRGLEDARRVPGVEDIVITAKEGQEMFPLPEGSAYLGFLFFRGASVNKVEKGLRAAHQQLEFILSAALSVVK
ncbi:MAG: ATP-dependent carboxylate-amine ligase domain protein ATP-grasp [Bryobacterales bacterium]|nr:ATP-dependent carboxylate-amine ligase domain protein ATP-grasp [Bryobacterales bacterium]